MAMESLQQGLYTFQSDVWSFGVTLWEIFSLGKTPYGSLSNQIVTMQVLGGNCLVMPRYSSPAIYKVMKACWADDPESRPSFSQLRCQIQALNLRYARGSFGHGDDDDYAFSAGLMVEASGRLVDLTANAESDEGRTTTRFPVTFSEVGD